MAFPTTPLWDLVYFDESSIGSLLSYAPADITVSPSVSPYFAYSGVDKALLGVSADGSEAKLTFDVALGVEFTWEVDILIPDLPKTLAMDGGAKLGVGFSNGAGSGAVLSFSELGLGFGHDTQTETLTALPDTLGVSQALRTTYYTIRVACDSTNDRAYVYINPIWQTPTIPLFVLPFPVSSGAGVFEIFVQGNPTDVAAFKLKGVRVSPRLETLKTPPRANPGPDRILSVGQTVRFDGRASADPEQDDLVYRWALRSAPEGSQYVHNGSASTTDDGDSDGHTQILKVPAYSIPAWIQIGDTIRISGVPPVFVSDFDSYFGTITVSDDLVPDDLINTSYHIFRQSFFLDPTKETAVGLPDVPGIYRIELIVNDGYNDSPPAEVIANVVGSRAPFGVEPRVEPIWQAVGDEWALLEGRDFFTEAWRGAAQMLGARLLEAWQHHYNHSVLDVQDTFQRKWLAYRTFTAESSPETATIDLKYGRVVSTANIIGGVPGIVGTTLVLEYYPEGSAGTPARATVTFSGESVFDILPDINAVLLPLGGGATLDAVTSHLVLGSTTFGFAISEDSTALDLLGLLAGDTNSIQGMSGGYISDFVYKVDDGIDLSDYSIYENDLLALSGVGYRIARVISDPNDLWSNQRLLLKDPIPVSASRVWGVPSILRSPSIDFSLEAAFPGDLLKFEAYDPLTRSTTFLTGEVVAFRGGTCGARLHNLAGATTDDSSDLEFLGLKRRKAILLPDGVVGIPQLQDVIPVRQDPTIWRENLHYVIDPIYRDESGEGTNVLQFRDSVFITSNTEPPDVFWAEFTHFDNNDNIEGRFGRLSGLSRDAFSPVGGRSAISYKSAVSGLLYAQQRGPILETIRVGAQVLFGQPFAETNGTIIDIQPTYSQTHGRMIVSDELDEEAVRTYHYLRDENSSHATSGLDINPRTGAPWQVGDAIYQFDPVGAGVTVTDYVSDPTWYAPRTSSGFSEVRKFHTYAVEARTNLVAFDQLDTLVRFVDRVSPTHKDFVISAVDTHIDDAPVEEFNGGTIRYKQYSCPVRSNRFMLDHYRGDGTAWVDEDDGPSLDEYLDAVVDLLTIGLSIVWGGGAFTVPAFFPSGYASPANNGDDGHTLIDVGGSYGAPGGTVVPTYNNPLLAGTYLARIDVKTTGLVLP